MGHEAVDFMEQVGRPLDTWQASMVVDSFALRPDGYWTCFEVVGLVPRQNGKGAFTEGIELPGLFLFHDQMIMHSAHLFKTAKQSFQRIVDIIDGSDWLTARVKKVIRARGDEEIELTKKAGGGRLLYFARSGGAGRGFTGDKTVFDEAAYLTIEQYQAATPTLATVPNPQIIYTATPPDEDVGPMPEDAMLPSVRKRGHEGRERIAIHEWSPPEKFDRNDPEVWAGVNPAYGSRIAHWFLAKQLENFTAAGKPEKFDTEHLGVWPKEAGSQWSVISEADWSAAQDPLSSASGRIVFALAMSSDRGFSAIAVAGGRADGELHAELVEHRPGSSWLVGRMFELAQRWKPARIVGDVAGPLGSEVADLNRVLKPLKLELTPLAGREIAAGFGMVHRGISTEPASTPQDWAPAESPDLQPDDPAAAGDPVPARRLRIRPHPTLTVTVAGASTRRAGAGMTWDEKSHEVTSIQAVTHAVHGFVTCPEPEPEHTVPLVAWR